ncbi:MAG: hypothetical protein AB1521_11570 [Bacteroidota bacterium]
MTEKDFAARWIERIRIELKKFPDDFLKDNIECNTIALPGKMLLLPPPLFNSYQIIDENGETIFATDDHYKAKYIIYANRYRPIELRIPKTDLHVYETVRDYEKHLDTFLKEMELEFKKEFPNSKGFKRNSTQVFNTLNLTRH